MNIEAFLKEFYLKLDGVGQLSEFADRFGSDKGFMHGNGHLYTQFYGEFFAPIRFKNNRIVEIGLLSAHHQRNFDSLSYRGMYQTEHGQTYREYPSLKMWAEYFPFSTIIGLDKENFEIDPRDHRILYEYFNANHPEKLAEILPRLEPSIIIDDASHISKHQQDTFFAGFPFLSPGGIYVIEDLNSIQNDFIPGYEKTEEILRKGAEGLRGCQSFKANRQRGEEIISSRTLKK